MSETDRYFFQHPDDGHACVLKAGEATGVPMVYDEEGTPDVRLSKAVVCQPNIHEAWKLLKREHGVTE